MTRILIVDDDPHIRELARAFLRNDGFEVVEAADGVEALAMLETTKVDLVVLDIMMPRMDGWELCRRLRESHDFPLLILTARGEVRERIKGFQLGTDDYLVKPFEPLELVARVTALLRRYRIATSQMVQLGELRMDRKTYEVTVRGEPLTIPPKEFELLFELASASGEGTTFTVCLPLERAGHPPRVGQPASWPALTQIVGRSERGPRADWPSLRAHRR